MFSRPFILLVQFAVMCQVTFSFDGIYVDNVVNYCQNRVNRFAATEEIYVRKDKRHVGEPVLFGEIFPELLTSVNKFEHSQRVFECIGDTLNGYSEEDLSSSYQYQNLVQTCISNKPWTPQCDPYYPYRMINGTCNNFYVPTRGSTLQCSRRLFPANFEVNVTGTLDCCKYANTRYQHPQCEPILHSQDDIFYSSKNVTCQSFVRLSPCHSCSPGKRLQINTVTAYIDCSLTYGSYDNKATELRRNDGSGKLVSQITEYGDLLPAIESQGTRCQKKIDVKQHSCVKSGDTRSNQHTLLAILQTILMREHNRIAEELKVLNPHWGEETLYQESRRILIAEFQVIIYKEFLPILLGPYLMYEYGLNVGAGSNYDFTVDPSISAEFNLAFRIHTLIPGKVVDDEDFRYFKSLSANLTPLYTNRTAAYLSKTAKYPAEKYDWYMPTDLTRFLYREESGPYGYDLAAVDIQRGRDVGLPTYAQIIEYMENRLGTITEFSDLKNYLVPECQKNLEETYDNVRDIDFWIGLNCERVPANMIISPTASKIIADQFRRLKYGDRFYVEHDVTLTSAQRLTLLNASLSKLICDNSYVEEIQPMAMLFPSIKNVQMPCSAIPGVDLQNWKE